MQPTKPWPRPARVAVEGRVCAVCGDPAMLMVYPGMRIETGKPYRFSAKGLCWHCGGGERIDEILRDAERSRSTVFLAGLAFGVFVSCALFVGLLS